MSQARSLSRAFIREAAKRSGIELTKEFEQEIVDEHIASVGEAVDKATTTLNEQLEAEKDKSATDEYKTKWEQEHEAFEKFKGEVEAKELNGKKQSEIKNLLKELSVSEKRHDIILKALSPDLGTIELDKDGKIKDVDKLKTSIATDWAEFIETTEKKPATTPNPPANTGGNGTTLEQFQSMGMRERSALQAKDPKRYEELSKQAKGAK